MKLILDTNAYCICNLGNDDALKFLEYSDSIYLPSIVYGELYYGFKHGKKFLKNFNQLESFIDEFSVTIINIDKDIAVNFGEIYSHLRKTGHPIPTNDIWISACVMSIGGTLLTSDKYFMYAEKIKVQLLKSI